MILFPSRKQRIALKAAAWAARRASGAVETHEETRFQAWFAGRPEHRESYRDATRILSEFEALASDPYARRLLRPQPIRMGRAKPMGGPAALAAASALAAAVALVVFLAPGQKAVAPSAPTPIVFETPRGGQERVMLADGSSITLDTMSRVVVAMSARERVVKLDRGQAHFQVAKDPNRPFRVIAGAQEVRALGTAFDMRRGADAVKVSLTEGKLALTNRAAPSAAASATLLAGQRADLRSNGVISIGPGDVERDGAWRSGRIILDGDRLADAVAEFNRYNDQQIAVTPAAADLRVSGVFRINEPAAFSKALAATLPVAVLAGAGPEGVLVVRQRPASRD